MNDCACLLMFYGEKRSFFCIGCECAFKTSEDLLKIQVLISRNATNKNSLHKYDKSEVKLALASSRLCKGYFVGQRKAAHHYVL